jgi:hypothetical protein
MPEAGASLGGALAAAPMLVGALLALGGLWMLLRRTGAVGPAALALVLGAGLLAMPRLLPVRPAPPTAAPPALGEGIGLTLDAGRTVAAPLAAPAAARPPPLPRRPPAVIAIEASEAEPNDTLAAANRTPLGVAIAGRVGPGDSDWFAFDVPADARGTLVVNLTVGDASAALGLYDDAGQTLGVATTFDALALRKATLERGLAAPRYHVLVRGGDAATDYHLTLAVRR